MPRPSLRPVRSCLVLLALFPSLVESQGAPLHPMALQQNSERAPVALLTADGQSQVKLWMAAANGNHDEVEHLFSGPIKEFYRDNIDWKDDLGWTALRAAVNYRHLACARTLLERGAYVDLADLRGDTPLMGAILTSDEPEDMVLPCAFESAPLLS